MRSALLRRATAALLAVVLAAGGAAVVLSARADAAEPLFTETVGFATKTGYRGVFSWRARGPVSAVVHYGTDPANLAATVAAVPGAADSAGIAIAEGLEIGRTYYWQVQDTVTGERSAVQSFRAANAYESWDGRQYTLNLLVQLDTESLPPGVPHDLALENIGQGINVFAERLYDATDGFARLGQVLVTDTNLDYGVNLPFLPPGCSPGLTNAADVLVQTTVPFDSHTFAGWSIEDPCISFYVGRIGQLVVPWGRIGGSDEDLHFGFVATHEMLHYAFNSPDLYTAADVNNPRRSGCWNLDWDGSVMHNSGGWNAAAGRWELTELDRNPALTPCDHQHSPVYSWQELRTRYTQVPERPNGPIEHVVDTLARGNEDGGALDIRLLNREPGVSTLTSFEPNDQATGGNRCLEPGAAVVGDYTYDARTQLEAHDLRSASISEPYDAGAGRLVFELRVAGLAPATPATTWALAFKDSAGGDRFVRMTTDASGAPSFSSGSGTQVEPLLNPGTPALEGRLTPEGRIRIVVDRAAVGATVGGTLSSFVASVGPVDERAETQRVETPEVTVGSRVVLTAFDNMPNSGVGTGAYVVLGSENCRTVAPVAGDDEATTAEDTSVLVPVLANDTDADGDALAVSGVTPPAHGSALVVAGGVRYTPAPNFAGTDSFGYSVHDGRGGTATGRVVVTVTPVPDAPVAFDDAVTIPFGTSLRVPVVANDADADGDALAVTGATDAARGSTQANADGTVRYTPDAGFSGTDVFDYTVSDGSASDTGRVTVVVLPSGAVSPCLPPGPVVVTDASNDHLDAGADTDIRSVSMSGVLPDGRLVVTLRVAGGTNPPSRNGVWRVRFTTPAGGIFYVSMETLELDAVPRFRFGSIAGSLVTDLGPADTGSVGPDGVITIGVDVGRMGLAPGAQLRPVSAQAQRFVGAAGNGGFLNHDTTATGQFRLAGCLVEPPNDPPSALDDTVATDEDTAADVAVLANDGDRNGDAVSVVAVGQGAHGTVSRNDDGTLRYVPAADFAGEDSFAYTVSDGQYTASATVRVTVRPVNDAPVALDDTATTGEDTATVVDVLANDADVDGDPLTVEAVGTPLHGTATVTPDGRIAYAPEAGYHGNDELTYTIGDGAGGTATATLRLTVEPVNDLPDARDDAATVRKNRSVTIAVLANDTDPDGDLLHVAAVGEPVDGTVRLNPDGTVTYTPRKGSKGTDAFAYTVSDGNGGTDTAVVTLTVE